MREEMFSKYLKRFREVHGDKYGYDDFEYVSNSTKSKIWCKIHKEYFEMAPHNHVKGQGCPKCGKEVSRLKRKTKPRDFILRAKEVHGDTYSYDMIELDVPLPKKIPIICKTHGVFYQTMCNHLSGKGCKKCAIQSQANSKRLGLDGFVRRAKEVHGDRYDYSLCVEYRNNTSQMPIICRQHGLFHQSATHHLSGKGCRECATVKRARHFRDSWEDFVRKAEKVHEGKYQYPENQKYVNAQTKVRILCLDHGEFMQVPNSHLSGNGCPECFKKDKSWFRQGYYKTTKPAYLYMLRMTNGDEEWLKVGITRNIRRRINNFNSRLPKHYKVDLLHTWEGPAWECFNLEWFVLYSKVVDKYREEDWDFYGKTECFRYEDYEPLVQHINSVADTLIGVCQTK